MRTKKFLVASSLTLSVSLSLAPPGALGQVPTASPAQPTAEQQQAEAAAAAARAELERKALKLLGEIGGEAAGLRLAENRVRTQAAVAELLWPHDEEAARETFRGAQTSLAAVAAAVTTDDPRYHQIAQSAHNLRREVVMMAANRDPKLALEMLRASRVAPPPAAQGRNFYQPDAELQLETHLAEQVAARDPKEAIRMAEESLSKGVSGNLPGIIERVRAHDPQAASRLASEAARRLRGANFSTNYEAAGVAVYLLRAPGAQQAAGAQPAVANGTGLPVVVPASGPPQGAFALDESARRDLLTAVVNAALAPTDAPGRGRGGRPLYGVVQQLMPEIERLLPAQAATLRRRMSESGAPGEGNARPRFREYEQLMSTGTVDALVEAAAKAPAEVRGGLYRSAFVKALNEGAVERARQIAGQAEGPEREQMLRELEQMLFWRAAEKGEVEQALAMLGRVRTPEERAGMQLALARMLAAREGRREVVERLLEEVWTQAGGRARNQSQFGTQLQVAQVYAQIEPARAFEIVEACVEQLNELLAAAAVVDGFGMEAFEQGELKGEGYLWMMLVQQAGEQLGQLAAADFERAVSTADRFQRPEARLRARLSVARGVLARDTLGGRGRRLFGPNQRRTRGGVVIN